MSGKMLSLWPPIETKVVSPAAVLRYQASQLGRLTNGLLEAEVDSHASGGDRVLEFRIIAPSLDGYSYELFQASHQQDLHYPVTIRFGPWRKVAERNYVVSQIATRDESLIEEIPTDVGVRSAATEAELTTLLQEILASEHTRSVIASLLAQINDAAEDAAKGPPA